MDEVNIRISDIKYKALKIREIQGKGSTIGFAPSQVKSKNLVTKSQKYNWYAGLNAELFAYRGAKGRIKRQQIEARSASTPPSFLGTTRKIA